MSVLTSLLVRDQVVSVKKIEQAIQKQVISGGDLDTVLLEMRALTENEMAAYCAAVHSLVPATREEVMSITRDTARIVPSEVAERHRVVPLSAEGRTLVVAVATPLPADVDQQLGFLLGVDLVQRVVPQVRIAAALSHHYGVEMTPRLRRLIEKLRKADPGSVPYVAPHEHSGTGGAKVDVARVPDKAGDVESSAFASPPPSAPAAKFAAPAVTAKFGPVLDADEASDGVPPERVDVAPVVGVGGAGASPASSPSQRPPSVRPAPAPSTPPDALPPLTSAIVTRHRGPLVAKRAVEMLNEAETRDDVLAILFAFTKQFFDYTALFAVKKDTAVLRAAAGVGADTIAAVQVPLDTMGAFAEARRAAAPRAVRLEVEEADAIAASQLGRGDAQPAVIVPMAIRQRVVLLVYGDLGGEAFGLADVPELLGFVPRVSEAFGRVILKRKFRDYGQAEGAKNESLKVTTATGAAAPAVATKAKPGTWGPGKKSAPPPALDASAEVELPPPAADSKGPRPSQFDLLGVPRSAPPPPNAARVEAASQVPPAPNVPAEARGLGDEETGGETPEEEGSEVPAAGEVSETRDDDAAAEVDTPAHDAPADDMPADDDDDEPELVVAEVDEHDAELLAAADDDDEPEVTVGEFAGDDEDYDDLLDYEEHEARPPFRRSERPASSTYVMKGTTEDVVAPRRHSSRPPPSGDARRDPRRAGGGVPPADVVHVPDRGAAGGRRSRAGKRRSSSSKASDPAPDEPKVIVDMGVGVEELVAEMLTATTDDHTKIDAVHELGEAALPVLVREFPGPLWFDRHAPHRRLPRGREVSAVAYALSMFAERAVPYVCSLLDRRDADARFYATLLAAEVPHPDLIAPLSRRVFDDDPGTRALALDVLRLQSRFEEAFADMLEGIRATAKVPRKDVEQRRLAIRALGELRDQRSVAPLARLLDAEETKVGEAAQQSLVLLTRQDFGAARHRWEEWIDEHGERHRIEWLIDGLAHAEEPIRSAASDELKHLTREYYGYHPALPKREREIAQRKYREWWQAEGQTRFAPKQ